MVSAALLYMYMFHLKKNYLKKYLLTSLKVPTSKYENDANGYQNVLFYSRFILVCHMTTGMSKYFGPGALKFLVTLV